MLHSPSISHPALLSAHLVDKFALDLDAAHGEGFTEKFTEPGSADAVEESE